MEPKSPDIEFLKGNSRGSFWRWGLLWEIWAWRVGVSVVQMRRSQARCSCFRLWTSICKQKSREQHKRERAAARGRSARCERSSATSSDSWVPRLEGLLLQLKQQLKSRGPPARPPPPANTVSQDFNYTKKGITHGDYSPRTWFSPCLLPYMMNIK